MKYIHLFTTTSTHNTAYNDWGGVHIEPWVALDEQTGNISYNDPDFCEIPNGRRFFSKGSITVSSSYAQGEITRTSGFESTQGYNVSLTYYFMPFDSETTYQLQKHLIHNEFDYYSIGLADGTYNGIFLT